MTNSGIINTSLESISYKDVSITTIVDFLTNKYGGGSFLINDPTKGNAHIITLYDITNSYLFFISTFAKGNRSLLCKLSKYFQ
jgi:hypothetical protein